jgi:hypothetical protein
MLRHLVEQISGASASKKEVGNVLKEIVTLHVFPSAHTPMTSFELLQWHDRWVVAIRYGQDSEQHMEFIFISELLAY